MDIKKTCYNERRKFVFLLIVALNEKIEKRYRKIQLLRLDNFKTFLLCKKKCTKRHLCTRKGKSQLGAHSNGRFSAFHVKLKFGTVFGQFGTTYRDSATHPEKFRSFKKKLKYLKCQ